MARLPFFLSCLMVIVAAVLFHPSAKAWAGSSPSPGRFPLTDDGCMQISKSDRCPVCAMVVANHHRFASAIQLQDGTTFYFCGTGCMIRSWLRPDFFLGVEKKLLSRAVVQDYLYGRFIDAESAWWVAGSDVVGPMGPALVPLESESDSNVFMRRHGGKTVFRLADLDEDEFQDITGKRAAPEK